MTREYDISKYHSSYRRYEGDWFRCIYCADQATTQEHVPPVSLAPLSVDRELFPCCRECNSVLAPCQALILTERAQYLAKALRKRYAKVLKMPPWTFQELSELGYNLRRSVETSLLVKQRVTRRLENIALLACH